MLREKMSPLDQENEKDTEKDTPAAITPRCCLCGSDCRYDDRTVRRFVGCLNLVIGIFLWPGIACSIGKVLELYTTSTGILLGLIVWFITFLLLIWCLDRWVCTRCGAIFPTEGKHNM
jgi:hypothetical protein